MISNAGFKDDPLPQRRAVLGHRLDRHDQRQQRSTGRRELYAANPNANALRWGTTYNFWFDATAAAETAKTIELFKPEPARPTRSSRPRSGYALNTAAPFDNPAHRRHRPGPTGDDDSRERPDRVHVQLLRDELHDASGISHERLPQFAAADANAYDNTCFPTPATPNGDHRRLLGRPARSIRVRSSTQTIGIGAEPPLRRLVEQRRPLGQPDAPRDVQDHPRRDHEQDHDDDHLVGRRAARPRRAASRARTASRRPGVVQPVGLGRRRTRRRPARRSARQILPSADPHGHRQHGPERQSSTLDGQQQRAVGARRPRREPRSRARSDLGPLGVINIGLTPGSYAVIADGAGAFAGREPGRLHRLATAATSRSRSRSDPRGFRPGS